MVTNNAFPESDLQLIRGVLGYLARFRHQTIVLAIKSSVWQACDQMSLVQDMMLLQLCEIWPILVIGSFPSKKTPVSQALNEIETATRQTIGLMASISRSTQKEGDSVGCLAESAVSSDVGDGKFGLIKSVDGEALKKLVGQGKIPVIPCRSPLSAANAYLLDLPKLTCEVACAVACRKLIFMVGHDGICCNQVLLRQVHPQDLQVLLDHGQISGPLAEITKAAIETVRLQVRRAHIINGLKSGSLLLEICTRNGVGTMIYRGDYREIRAAVPSDLPGIKDLLQRYAGTGMLRPLSQQEIESKLPFFLVAVVDQQVVGCGAVQCFPEESKAFMSSVAVGPESLSEGIGSQLLEALEARAVEAGVKFIGLVSPKTGGWWLHQAFTAASLGDLPDAIRPLYSQGHPIILGKRL